MTTPEASELESAPNPYDLVADLTYDLAALLQRYIPGQVPPDFHTKAMCVMMNIACLSMALDRQDLGGASASLRGAEQLLQELRDITPPPTKEGHTQE